VKYIRYAIYLAFLGLAFGGGYWVFTLLAASGAVKALPSARGLVTALVFCALPVFRALRKDRRPGPALPEAVRSDALRQETSFSLPLGMDDERARAAIKEALNGLVEDEGVFVLVHEEEDFLVYRSEAIQTEVGWRGKRRMRRHNPILVEVEFTGSGEDRRMGFVIGKEGRYTELSNRDNDELAGKILAELGARGLAPPDHGRPLAE
jgi:hypothetical protein